MWFNPTQPISQEIELDPTRDAAWKIFAAAKSAVCKRKAPIAKELDLLGAAISGSLPVSSGIPCPAGPASSTGHTGTSNTNGAEDDDDDNEEADKQESLSDDEPTHGGFMSTIKAFVPATERTSTAPKATAKPKSTPASKATAKAKGASAAKPKAAPKTVFNNPGKRRKTGDDLSNGIPCHVDGAGSDLSDADLQLVNDYKIRISESKRIEPPVADGPFKSYLSDVHATLTTLKNEMKTKKRSALRRQDKELDPLFLTLSDLINGVESFCHFLKCILDFWCWQFLFLL